MSQLRRLIATSRGAWILPAAFLFLFPVAATAANLASVTVNPTSILSGSPLEVTFTLDGPAPAPNATVRFVSSDPVIVSMPAEWAVPAGAISNSISFRTTGNASTTTQVTITASCGGVDKTATVTVTPREPARGVAGDLWADVILGQPDFGEITFNEVTSRRVFNPTGVTVDRSVSPNRIYVHDTNNSRVLGLSHLGTCQGLPVQTCTTNSDCGDNGPCLVQEGRGADIVLGQPSFDRSACNGDGGFQRFPMRASASAGTLCSMTESILSVSESFIFENMAVDGSGNLYVPDILNSRVLRYNSPFTTDTIADDVWGQADFTGKECNRGRGLAAPDNQSLCFEGLSNAWVSGVATDPGGNLWVADNVNNRVLRFPCCDTETGNPSHTADLVLGQQGFNTSAQGSGLAQMRSPGAVRMDGAGSLWVADSLNRRVLIFDPPLFNGKTARKLNFNFGNANAGTPTGLELDPAGGMWVNDTNNNQLLLFVGGVVQKVLFKDVATSSGGCGGNFLGDGPPFAYDDGNVFGSSRLCVTGGSIGVDSEGNVFASGMEPQDVWRFPVPIPAPHPGIAHSADARLFKGYQFGFQNEVGPAGIYNARGVAVAANQLIVSDGGRILFWDNPPNLANGQAATGFVGQPVSHVQGLPFFGRIREDGSSHLWAVRGDKVVAYSLPLQTGQDPIWTIASPLPVLGGGTLTWDGFLVDGGIAPVGPGDKVWIADPVRNRVFRIRNALTAPVVDIVLGQTSATGTACNQGHGTNGLTQTSLCNPNAVRLDPSGNLYVADQALEAQGNFRLLEYDAVLFPDPATKAVFAIPASRVFGNGGSFTLRTCGAQELCAALWEPAFTSDGQMVVGGNGYMDPRFPYVYTNPLVNQHVSDFLNDFSSMGYAATFDASNNLYMTDLNRSRVLIYLNPLSPAPATSILTVTRTGAGTGTVKSTPLGIDCGTACSQPFIDGTSVTLSTVPGANSIFAGWTGDADCADGVVTMNGNKTCTARFDLMSDLIVFALTVPAGALAGSTISVADTTKNSGTGPAGASTTRFYLSTNSTWDVGDTPLGYRSIPIVAPGGINSGTTDVTIPAGKATGNYYIIAKADADSLLLESSETNNTKYAAIHIGPPDLVVLAISVPTTGGAGTNIIATNTTKNNTGTGPAPGSITKFYLSTNSTLDGSDPEIGSQSIGILAPGASEVHSNTSLTIPPGTTPGTKYVIAKADADGLVGETLENNNTAYDTIVIGPDLIVSALTVPAYGGAGLPVIITSTTKNQGGAQAAASATKFYLSTNNTWDAGDTFLGDRAIAILNAGATSAGNVTLTIPANTPLGNYYVLARADGATVIPETIETNNVTAAAIKLTPDLVVSALTVPASAQAGHPFNVTDTTKCSGMGVAAASTAKFYLSTNATWDAGDTEIGSRSVGQLTYNATSAGTTSLTIPTAGTWYVLAKADATGVVAETNEGNNVLSKVITITP